MYFGNLQYLYLLPLTALPLIIYLIFRRKPRKIIFSSLFLLKNLTKNVNRRTKLKDILLLIIRTLLLLSLILIFAAPFLGNRTDFDPGKKTEAVFYFDTSSSMADAVSGTSKFDMAKNMLIRSVNDTPQNISIYILTSDPEEQFKGNKNDALKFLSSINIYGRERPLKSIAGFADSLFAEGSNTNKILAILTDGFTQFDENISFNDNYQKKALLFRSEEGRKADISLDSVIISDRTFLFMALSSAPGSNTRLDIFQDGRKIFAQDIMFGSERSKMISVELNDIGKSGAAITAEITDEGSNLLNNSYHFLISELDKKKILLVGDKDSRAVNNILTLINTNPDSVLIPELIAPESVNSVKFSDFSMIFFCGVSNFSSYTASALKNYITEGGSVYFSAGDKLNLNDYNSNLINSLGFPPITAYEKLTDSFTEIKIEKMEHPVFRDVFSESFTGVNSAEIFSYYKVGHKNWTRLISAGGDPLLLERKLGKGNILFLTTGLERQNSNILENGISIPLILNSMMYLIGNDPKNENTKTVGDTVESEKYFYLIKPGKTLDINTDELSKKFFLKAPGFYKSYSEAGYFLGRTAVNYEREIFVNNSERIMSHFKTITIDDKDYSGKLPVSFESKDLRIHFLILILFLLCSEILLVRLIK